MLCLYPDQCLKGLSQFSWKRETCCRSGMCVLSRSTKEM